MSKLAAAGLSSTVAGPGAWSPSRQGVAREAVRPGDGLVQRRGALGLVQAGGTEATLEVRAALADEHGCAGPFGHDRSELGQVDALVAATGDEDERRRRRHAARR